MSQVRIFISKYDSYCDNLKLQSLEFEYCSSGTFHLYEAFLFIEVSLFSPWFIIPFWLQYDEMA